MKKILLSILLLSFILYSRTGFIGDFHVRDSVSSFKRILAANTKIFDVDSRYLWRLDSAVTDTSTTLATCYKSGVAGNTILIGDPAYRDKVNPFLENQYILGGDSLGLFDPTNADSLFIYLTTDTTVIKSQNPINISDGGLIVQVDGDLKTRNNFTVSGDTLIILDATLADTLFIFDGGDSVRFKSTNPVKFSGTVISSTLNGLTDIQLNGVPINTGGTLPNVSYLDQENIYTENQQIVGGDTLIILDGTNADSIFIYDDGDTTRVESTNPIKIGDGSLIVQTDGNVKVTNILNADSLQLGASNINAKGVLSNVAYLNENLEFDDPGTTEDSYSITFMADNTGTQQTGTIQLIQGVNPYFRFSPPNATSSPTTTLDMRSDKLTFFNGGTDLDYIFEFNGQSHDGTIIYMEDEDRFDFNNDVDIVGDLTAGTIASDGDVYSNSTSKLATEEMVVDSAGALNDSLKIVLADSKLYTHSAIADSLTDYKAVINAGGALDNVAYLDQSNEFEVDQILGTGEAGVTTATGNTLRAPDITTGGAGDIAGADLTISAGLGTGIGDVGKIILNTTNVAAAGDNIQTSSANTLVLDGGKVGIGATPLSPLYVKGNVSTPTVISGIDTYNIATFTVPGGATSLQILSDPTTNDTYIGSFYTGGNLHFSTRTSAVNYERLVITDFGECILGAGELGNAMADGNIFRAPNITTGGAGNIAGADLIFQSGLGTGTGDVGKIILNTTKVAAAGDNIQTSSANTLVLDGGKVGMAGEADPDYALQVGVFTGGTNIVAGNSATLAELRGGYKAMFGNNVVSSETVSDRMDFSISHATRGARAIKMSADEGITFHGFDGATTKGDQFTGYERFRIDPAGIIIAGTGEGRTTLATGTTLRAPDITTGGAGNIAGADLTFAAGLGTGTGDAGTLKFQTPRPAATGDNIQNRTTLMTLDEDSVIISGVLKSGDNTNNAIFADNGKLTLSGTARVKNTIRVFTSQELQRGIVPPTPGSFGCFAYEEYTINDDSIINVHGNLRREANTDIEIEIGWACDETYATANGEIQWQIQWAVIPEDASVAIDNPTYSGTVVSGDLNIPAVARGLTHTAITIPGTNIGQNDEIGFILKRIDIDGGTDPTAEPGITCVRIIAINDKLGEGL